MVTPCGVTADATWQSLVAGRSGIGPITQFDATAFASRIAGEIRDWDPSPFVDKKKRKEVSRFEEFALASAAMAVHDAELDLTEEERDRAACVIGVGIGGLGVIERTVEVIREKGPSKVSPYSIPAIATNLAAGQISIAHRLRGPSLCTSTACASSAHAIGEAFEMIRHGRASVALAGGAEATITPTCIAGFQAMFALSRRNDDPEKASRPFDKGRDGFVCSEGGAVLVLEPLARARKRGARIYAEVTGYGASSDAFHPVQPASDGAGARASMRAALQDARLPPDAIDYLNAHGTSTPLGDVQECKAVAAVFGDHATSRKLWMSSTKSMTGHLLGAAGAAEAAVCALACAHGVVPPTINIEEQDPDCALEVVPNHARERQVRHALSNSFGFGGTNVTLILSRVG